MRFAPGTDPQVVSAATQQWLNSQPPKTPPAATLGPTIGATGAPHPRASAGQVRIDSLIHGSQPPKTPPAATLGPTIGATGTPQSLPSSSSQGGLASLFARLRAARNPGQTSAFNPMAGGLGSFFAHLQSVRQQPLSTGQFSGFRPSTLGGLGGLQTSSMFSPRISGPFGSSFSRGFSFYR